MSSSTHSTADYSEEYYDAIGEALSDAALPQPLDPAAVRSFLSAAPGSPRYCHILSVLTAELTPEAPSPVASSLPASSADPVTAEEASTFYTSLMTALRPLGYDGESADLSESEASRMALLEDLLSDVQAVRMARVQGNTHHLLPTSSTANTNTHTSSDIDTLHYRRLLAATTHTVLQQCHQDVPKGASASSVSQALTTAVGTAPDPPHRPPLVSPDGFDPEQHDTLNSVEQGLWDEYRLRRRIALKRADVTIDSMVRDGRGGAEETASLRAALDDTPGVDARYDLRTVTEFSAAALLPTRVSDRGALGSRLDCFVKGVVIGNVPDRGGRVTGGATTAKQASSSTMPGLQPRSAGAEDWKQKARSGGGKKRGGGGGRGGGRGNNRGRGGGWNRGGGKRRR
eukprot:gb/GECH01013977.1/.p1 GENE.gb/GECH01013977.1/~~gb/GECH01013977.1/.p1  ORF type:complete len:400 (+),score=114.81 gb/GECH01013977.1/:1-1200(+)